MKNIELNKKLIKNAEKNEKIAKFLIFLLFFYF